MKFAVIVPVFNEELRIKGFIDSIIQQEIKPDLLLFIDDGCTDGTIPIIENYKREHLFIRIETHLKDSIYSSGAKIARAVNFGITKIELDSFDVVCKLDCDLNLPEDYFKIVLDKFKSNTKLGLCGGVCVINGEIEEIISDNDHVRGALKAYRVVAYKQIGGIRPVEGWDSLDELLLRFYNWEVEVLQELKVMHSRKTDTNTGALRAALKTGRSYYIIGYSFPVVLTASVKLIFSWPFIIKGLIALYGYFNQMMKGRQTDLTKEQIRFFNSYRYSRMKNKIRK